MDERSWQMLSQIAKENPAKYDLSDEQVSVQLAVMKNRGYISVYNDGSAYITGLGMDALSTKKERVQREAAQRAQDIAQEHKRDAERHRDVARSWWQLGLGFAGSFVSGALSGLLVAWLTGRLH